MRIGRFEITFKAPVSALTVQNSSALMPYGGGWLSTVLEPFTGAWQRNISSRGPREVLAFSAVYTCVSLIAGDISKLRIKLVEQVDGIWQEVKAPAGNAFRGVLVKPNDYQTRIQFLMQWICSKLIHGNAYIFKRRDDRQVVNAMYVLDPCRVVPMVAENGTVFYVIKRDPLATVTEDDYAVEAEDIIHDRMAPFWHPLIGVSPIYACGAAAMQGLRIQEDSEKFFSSRSNPSGVLSIPTGGLTDDQLDKMKAKMDANYGPTGNGGTLVMQHGMTWTPMRMSAVDAQLIEQLRWTVEDVARCFKVPLHMLGVAGSNPSYNNIGALNQQYYGQTLQLLIEDIEELMDHGLGLLNAGYGAELDLESLVRMDPAARMETAARAVGAGIWAPDEARAKEDMLPVPGGATPYLQQQNFSLAALDRRDKAETPTSLTASPAAVTPAPQSEPEEEEEVDDAVVEAGITAVLIKNADAVRLAA